MNPAAMARTADTPTPMPAEPAVLLTVPPRPVEKIDLKTASKIAQILLIQSPFVGLLMKLR
jgi:hypothetical protein